MSQEAFSPSDPSSLRATGLEVGLANRSSVARDRGKLVALGAMGALVAAGVALIVRSPHRADAPAPAGLTSAPLAAAPQIAVPAPAAASAAVAPTPRPPPVWRVADMKGEAGIEVVEGTFGKRTLGAAIGAGSLAKNETQRLAQAFEDIKRIDPPHEKDSFVLAKDRAKATIAAFEYVASPTDIWQAKTDADGRLVVKKLDVFVEQKKLATALVISADLEKAIEKAGLRKELIEQIDDAVEAHLEPGTMRPGVRMRVAVSEQWVEGAFMGVRVDGLEIVPKSGSPIRVYYYERGADVEGKKRTAPLPGYYDAKGKQPYRGAFRSPIPLARVTSRFNPKRMHPVLHTVMPHQGVDFGASTGTPVFASAAGTVVVAGNGGPCGNMVEIAHADGIATVYCHLSRFAPGLHAGQHVEARQPIGNVGATGRVTGPHLHFGVKRNGAFIDPLGLKLDGVRVLPPVDRDAFAKKRADVDALIDGVALPSAQDVPDEPDEKEAHTD